jgi:hypothetical protein
MRNKFLMLIAFSGIMAVSSCTKKIEPAQEDLNSQEIVVEDSLVEPETPSAETKTINGKVLEVVAGKDGYTAKLETADKEIYYATVSHSNLTNHEQYKAVKVGETLKVTGDFWTMEDKNQITVRVIE